MTGQLVEIGGRLSALREIMDLSPEAMAEKMNIEIGEYNDYEIGKKDFSFSFLYNAATILGVDVLDIISGESPKLSTCALVKKGTGYDILRRSAYNYKHLAFTFRNKKAEPFLVTVEPKADGSGDVVKHSHAGQEFNYMLDGSMELFLGDTVYQLDEGDSVYFDSGVPHAMKAVGSTAAKFLAIVF